MNGRTFKALTWCTTLLLAAVVAGCGDGGGGSSAAVSTTAAGAGTGAGGAGMGPSPVNLGGAGNFVILAKSAISTVPASAITGNLGLSPAAASFITGFTLVADATNQFSTSTQVTGQVFAADYAAPTPTNLTTAVLDMQAAYTDAAGRAPDYTELGAGNIGGLNLGPATYKWGSGVLITSNVTLTGGPNDVWIFQIAQDLTVASGVQVVLAGGALAKNIFWQTFGAADFGTTSHFEGVVLSQTSITAHTGASVNGRLLAQTAVTLDQNMVTQPAP
jgi:ice-binding like protein